MTESGPKPEQGEFSRRSFILFLFLAPACFLCIIAIIFAMQYRQFRSMISPVAEVNEVVWTDADHKRLASLTTQFETFSKVQGSDTISLSAQDLNLLTASSGVAKSQGYRFRFEIGDSLIMLHSTQNIQDLQGRLAWIFQKLGRNGFTNATLQGRPKLSSKKLEMEPERGWMGGQKVPSAALSKRGGMSPQDFLSPDNEVYIALLNVLSEVKLLNKSLLLIRKP